MSDQQKDRTLPAIPAKPSTTASTKTEQPSGSPQPLSDDGKGGRPSPDSDPARVRAANSTTGGLIDQPPPTKVAERTKDDDTVNVNVVLPPRVPKVETKTYRKTFGSGRHHGPNGLTQDGDEVELTDAQYHAFRDRFEPVGGKNERRESRQAELTDEQKAGVNAPIGPTSHISQDASAQTPDYGPATGNVPSMRGVAVEGPRSTDKTEPTIRGEGTSHSRQTQSE